MAYHLFFTLFDRLFCTGSNLTAPARKGNEKADTSTVAILKILDHF